MQWVLGEQSAKQLRSDEISDVIARGNVRRAEKKEAEAYLTFDECQDVLDTDRDQIEVGRKVNTDGEGTYYLNGEEVRLKDVQDLFRDTGIGQDLYSSIGQGEVLKLIDSKPEERREIIEEAAGIASYRHRRDLTRRRLEKTRTELQQVDKDLREKKGRLSQLRGQAEKAEKVRELQSELRTKRRRLAARDYRRVNETIDDLEETIEENRDRLEELKNEKSDVEQRKTTLQSHQQSVESELNRLKSLAEPIRDRRQELREKMSEYRTRAESLRDQRERELQNVKQRRRQHESELNGLSRSYEDARSASLNRRIRDVERTVLGEREDELVEVRQKLRKKRETLRERSLFKRTEIREIDRKLNARGEELDDLRGSRRELNQELSSLRKTETAATERLTSNARSLFHAESDATELELQKSVRAREASVVDNLAESLRSRRNELRNQVDRLKKRREKLNKRIESRDGVPAGARRLLEEDGDSVGRLVEGLLAEHISVDEEYADAVEAVLGDRLQDVLVDSSESPSALWDWVADHEENPVRLRPLVSGVEDGSVELPEELASRVEVPALEAVEASPRAEGLVRQLLENVFVVERVSEVLATNGKVERLEDSVTFVDYEGSLFESDGTLSFREGGRRSGGLLQWKQELSRVEKELERTEESLETVTVRFERLKEMKEDVEHRKKQMEGSLQGLNGEVRGSREAIREARHERRRARSVARETLDELRENERQRLSTKYRREAAASIQVLVKNRGSERTDRIQDLEDRIDALEQRIGEVRKKQRSSEQSRSVAESRLQDSESRIQEQQERLVHLEETIEETRNHVEELTRERLRTLRHLHERSLRLDWIESERNSLDDLGAGTRERRDELASELEDVNESLRDYDKSIEQKRGTVKKTESELSNERARRGELVEKIEDDLEVEPAEEILEHEDEEASGDDRGKLSERVRQLKGEIRELQPVNMLASEEAEELGEEVREIQEQYDDLEDSCEKLESLIDRLNTKARKQFQEAFAEIQDYFEDFVAELFQGGRGAIELTDDPVLEAGVTIEIEPPGEQLRTMSALSGGEKTLGAFAFLFALYERKSTPFCFLDEVDHPLDDENVNQFIQLLSRYRNKTQFIIITHNKLTMQAADKLFGITMEESGVTSIVPMELEDAESLRDPQEVG